jgi:hypothetical protein
LARLRRFVCTYLDRRRFAHAAHFLDAAFRRADIIA